MAVKKMSQQTIYNKLKAVIKNDYGVCGLMGNLKAESNLRPNNLQNSYNKSLGMTDEEYTKAVDDGSYKNFVTDKAGYGLAQWTYWSRKQNLLNYANKEKASIGDEDMQVNYLIYELQGYTSVWNVLLNAKSVREASDAVLLWYEKPKNQSEENCARRAKIGEELYYELVGKDSGKIQNNSRLVDYVELSPYNSGKRKHVVDRITPHCFVGQVSVERIGKSFKSRPAGKEASCNYGIGLDGRVALIVEEQNMSWCSSSESNDQRAITIECASDNFHPYAFKDAVYNKLVELCVDICKRYSKKKLIWINDKVRALAYMPKSDEMLLTVHRWFANKACPGDWMYTRMSDLADTVTAKLGGVTPVPPEPVPFEPYKVRVDIDNLNIRTGPGTNYPKTGKATGRGIFTIVEESPGEGSIKGWGKLKSGAGWISLDFATKL